MDIIDEVKAAGASLWLDSLDRDMLLDGRLAGMVRDLGVTGVTSNPSIFEAAILKSSYYTEPIESLAARDASAELIFETLAVEDIQRAADLFRDIHKETRGRDGFVSIEVKPSLAHDAARTVKEGDRLFEKIGRVNVLIKVPATLEGVQAGCALLKKGVNVNFTLIFSPDRYEAVVKAYIDALTWRTAGGLPVDGLASVASFFVSRIDTATDEEIETLMDAEDAFDSEELYDFAAAARGRTAIANSLLAYAKYALVFSSREFLALREKGAMKQRILWASTGVKNPAYKDTLYADALLLPDSINTLPESALKAFVHHGAPDTAPLPARVAVAASFFTSFAAAGIGFFSILEFLERDGVDKFCRAWDSLISHIEEKKRALAKAAADARPPAVELPYADYGPMVGRLESSGCHTQSVCGRSGFAHRLWKRDAGIWKTGAADVKTISHSLGWLDAPFKMLSRVKEIGRFRDEIIAEGFTAAVVLGMGGSSLAPEVMRTVFQSPKHPKLTVLDTTDPGWILAVAEKLDLKKTLFIFASKSGVTIEPAAQFKYFWSLLKKAGVKKPGNQFAAITDPGTPLAALAKEKKFRKVFLNAADIGGRFSALSYFGLVPAALCGADIKKLLERAIDMANLCKEQEVIKNPGALLGALIGGLALQGRDKLTIIMPKKLEAFGLWVEQLIAESTGKEGKGVVPICQERLSAPETYKEDRFFVNTQLGVFMDPGAADKLGKLKTAGAPVYTMFLHDIYDLGGEFFRWEIAAAAACAMLEVNPFDQPDVQAAKALTLKALEAPAAKEQRPEPKPQFSADRLTVFASKALRVPRTLAASEKVRGPSGDAARSDIFRGLFQGLIDKEYTALLAYLPNAPKVEAELADLRETIRTATGAATTLSYGPRYLHSSGQLHKGGPDNAFSEISA